MSSAVQFPFPPNIGGALASHGFCNCLGALDSINLGRNGSDVGACEGRSEGSSVGVTEGDLDGSRVG